MMKCQAFLSCDSNSIPLVMILPVLLLEINKFQEQISVALMSSFQASSLLALRTNAKNCYICNLLILSALLLQNPRNVAMFSISIWASFMPTATYTERDRKLWASEGGLPSPWCAHSKVLWKSPCKRISEKAGSMSSQHCCF